MKIKKSKSILWQQSVSDIWHLYAPPVTPSKSELKIWEDYLKQRKKGKTLIVGATPELRDLTHKLGHIVVVVDVSLSMLMDMERYMETKEEETLIRADWITMPLKKDYFDFIIGDLVLCNMPFLSQELFLKKIQRILTPNGLFIHRHMAPLKKIPVKKTVDYYLTLKKTNKQQLNELCIDLSFSSYNKHDFTVSTEKARKNIINFNKKLSLRKRKKVKKLFDMYNIMYRGDKTWWDTPPNKADKIMKKYFKIISIKNGNDHRLVKKTPIYVLKK